MFDVVQKNKRIAQVILALLILPFAFFGMESYFSNSEVNVEIARIGDQPIRQGEFDRALREQVDRQRQRLGGNVDPRLIDTPELRRIVIDAMLTERALALYAAEHRLSVPVQQLQDTIRTIQAFQGDNGFSMQRYQQILRAQGMNEQTFEAQLRNSLVQQNLLDASGQTALVFRSGVERLLAAQLESRELRSMNFTPAEHAAGLVADEAALRAIYDRDPARFEQPARVKAAYVMLDADALASQIQLSDDEVRAWYDSHRDRYTKPEERRASHILFQLDPKADAAAADKLRAEAQRTLDELRATPERFAELAKARSQDPGSAAQGGDLGFFGRGVMVPAFEEAVYALQKGQIAELVKTDFGFHVIMLTDLRPAQVTPLDEVKGEIAAQLRREQAGRRYAEAAEEFTNLAYEQADSLEPLVQRFGLTVQRTDWMERGAVKLGEWADQRLAQALFSADATQQHRNTEAIEITNGKMLTARVEEFQPARRLPFEEARPAIEKEWLTQQSAERARAAGQAALAKLQAGEAVSGRWSASRKIVRGEDNLPPAAMKAVFTADIARLPVYVGVEAGDGGYVIHVIDKADKPVLAADDARLAQVQTQLTRLLGERDSEAFVESLKLRYKTEINQQALVPASE